MKRLVRTTLAAACAAAMALSAAPALAAASSSASFGNLVITLTDLDLNDGITPSITFNATSQAFVSVETRSWSDEYSMRSDSKSAPTPNASLSDAVHTTLAGSSATLQGADTAAGFSSLSVAGHADSVQGGYGFYFATAAGADPYPNVFTLSGNTRVTFSTTGSLKAETTIGYNLEADQAERALAVLLMNLHVNAADGSGYDDSVNIEREALFDVRDDGTTMGESYSWSGDMAVGFSNTSSLSVDGTLEARANIGGISAITDGVPPPVPEPSTYAMLLGGLALLGVVRRKRRD